MKGTNRTRPSHGQKRPADGSARRSVCLPTPVGVPVLRFVHTNPCTNVAATLGSASLPSRPRSACLGLDGPLDGQYLCRIGTRDCLKPCYGKHDIRPESLNQYGLSAFSIPSWANRSGWKYRANDGKTSQRAGSFPMVKKAHSLSEVNDLSLGSIDLGTL